MQGFVRGTTFVTDYTYTLMRYDTVWDGTLVGYPRYVNKFPSLPSIYSRLIFSPFFTSNTERCSRTRCFSACTLQVHSLHGLHAAGTGSSMKPSQPPSPLSFSNYSNYLVSESKAGSCAPSLQGLESRTIVESDISLSTKMHGFTALSNSCQAQVPTMTSGGTQT